MLWPGSVVCTVLQLMIANEYHTSQWRTCSAALGRIVRSCMMFRFLSRSTVALLPSAFFYSRVL